MSIRLRLIVMNFLQFFVWGSWLTSLGVYLGKVLHFSGGEIAGVFSTMGVASLLMPALIGIVADKWINTERLLAVCHLAGGIVLFYLMSVTGYTTFFWLILLYNLAYMPTLGLANSLAFQTLKGEGLDVVKDFPPIRIWGTIGFIAAMWLVDLLQWTSSRYQLVLAAAVSFLYGLYALTLPKCRPARTGDTSLSAAFGLEALALFKDRKMAVFFIFSMLIGAALQITNTFGQPFLSDFAANPAYRDSFATLHPGILTSVSQISEALFILSIPFFLKRYGIKTVILMSIGAWVLRFGLFAWGNPGEGFLLLLLSMIVYGMAFDFFNVSGSLFIEQETQPHIRASSQGLFILMTNGIGTIIGTKGSGWVVDYFTNDAGVRNWHLIWLTFAVYACILGILFAFTFRIVKPAGANRQDLPHPDAL